MPGIPWPHIPVSWHSVQLHHMGRRAVVVLFARLPIPGKAKTRLAVGIGSVAAATFYKLCAEAIFHEASRCQSADAVVYCSKPDEVAGMQQWLQQNDTPLPVQHQQQTPDLGQRMIAAVTSAATATFTKDSLQQEHQQQQCVRCDQQLTVMTAAGTPADSQGNPAVGSLQQQLFQQQQQQQLQQQQQQLQHHYSAAVVVGTDIPDLSAAVLEKALAALQQYDMVLGPAEDGGYYLMGFRTEALLRPDVQSCKVFEGVTWSTASVLKHTAQAAAALGLRLAPSDVLPVLQDIDYVEDLQAWMQQYHLTDPQRQQQQQWQQREDGHLLQRHQDRLHQQQWQHHSVSDCHRDRLLAYAQSLNKPSSELHAVT